MFKRFREDIGFIRGNVLVLMTSGLLTAFAGTIPTTYFSLYVLGLGGTPFIIGLIGSASSIVTALVQLIGGYLADSRERKRLVFLMTLGSAMSYVVFATALSWHFLLVGTFVQSLFLMFQPAESALTADSIPPEKRGFGYSILNFVGAVSILSPLVAGFLYLTQGTVSAMRIAFWIAALSFFVAAAMRLKLKETFEPGPKKAGSILQVFRDSIMESLSVWKVLPRNALFLIVTSLLSMFFVNMTVPYYVIYTTTVLKVDELQYSTLIAWELAVYYVSLLPIGKIIDKTGRKNPLMLSSVLNIIGIWLFINGDLPRLYIAYFLFALGNSLVFVAYPSLQADVVPRKHRGKVFGFSSFATGILSSISVVIGGFIYEYVSVQLPFTLLLASMVLTIILTLFLIHEPKKREE